MLRHKLDPPIDQSLRLCLCKQSISTNRRGCLEDSLHFNKSYATDTNPSVKRTSRQTFRFMRGESGVALRWLSIRSLTYESNIHTYLSIQQEDSTMHLFSSLFVILGSIQIYKDCDINWQQYLPRA